MRSPLAKYATTNIDPEQVKHQGWHEHGILVVRADDERLNWLRREQVKQLGEFLYGQRGNHANHD